MVKTCNSKYKSYLTNQLSIIIQMVVRLFYD